LLDGPRTNGKLALLVATRKHADPQEVVALTGPHDRLERLTNDPYRNPPCSSLPRAAATNHTRSRARSRAASTRTVFPSRPLEAATSPRKRQRPQAHDRSLKLRTRRGVVLDARKHW
jgi:hypothetical protein